MAERLTDKTAKTSGFSLLDLIHVVDVSDNSANAEGTSFKAALGDIFKELAVMRILDCMVLKTTNAPDTSKIQDDDVVLYVSDTRLIAGRAKADVLAVPADLDDDTKFIKFLDNTPLL